MTDVTTIKRARRKTETPRLSRQFADMLRLFSHSLGRELPLDHRVEAARNTLVIGDT